MSRIVLVRHGQTEWNRVERFRGLADLDLNELGRRQAKAVAEKVAQWSVVAVYSSPLRRAATTAQIIGKRVGLEVKLLPGLIDINFGEWQGLSPEEAMAKDGSLYSLWLKSPHLVRFPGGESLEQVRDRAVVAVNDLMTAHSKGTIVLVSHKVVCQLLLLHFLDLDSSHFWQVTQDVSAINLFEVNDGRPVALLLNDTCHLKQIKEKHN